MIDAASSSSPAVTPTDRSTYPLSGQFRDADLERRFRTEYGHILLQRDRFIVALIFALEIGLIFVDQMQLHALPELTTMRIGMRGLYMGTLLIAYFYNFSKPPYSEGTQRFIVFSMLVHNLLIATYHHPYLTANTGPGFLLAVYVFTITACYTFLTAWLPGTLIVTLCLGGQYLLLRWWLEAPGLDQTYAPFLLFSLVAFSHFTAVSQARQHRLIWLAAKESRDQQRRAEDLQIFRARLLELVGHDLHQPLGALRYYIAAMRIGAANFPCRESERSVLLADQVSRTVDEITDMLDKVLELAQLDIDQIAHRCQVQPVVPLVAHLRDQFSPAAALAGVELRIHGSRRHVMHDPALLLAVLRNLIRNALNYHRHQTSRPRVVLAFRGDIIDIIDNGGGLPEEVMARLHDKASSQLQGQHGLGLVIARQLALKQGWLMSIDNWPGRGARFRLRFQALPTGRIWPTD